MIQNLTRAKTLIAFSFLLTILTAPKVFAGASGCQTDAECEAAFSVDNTCQGVVCVAAHSGENLNYYAYGDSTTGCAFITLALVPTSDLEEICYYCDPAQLSSIDTCGNGICSPPTETCGNCPEDCIVPAFPGDTCTDTTGQTCTSLTNCEDGDVCTFNICDIAPTANIGVCAAPQELGCSGDIADFCCPSGCQGPGPGITCEEAEDGPNPFISAGSCDVDCWPAQVCGDGYIQAPETCDGSIPTSSSAGIDVTKTQCREPGIPNECTYCGDGIVDSPTEECDGANDSACGGNGCSADCVCNSVSPCLEGSGFNNNSGKAVGDCTGWSGCSLNRAYSSKPDGFALLLGFFAMGILCRFRMKRN